MICSCSLSLVFLVCARCSIGYIMQFSTNSFLEVLHTSLGRTIKNQYFIDSIQSILKVDNASEVFESKRGSKPRSRRHSSAIESYASCTPVFSLDSLLNRGTPIWASAPFMVSLHARIWKYQRAGHSTKPCSGSRKTYSSEDMWHVNLEEP